MHKRAISVVLISVLLLTFLSSFTYAVSGDGEWEYYLGSQNEYGFGDARQCWQMLFRKDMITGEKQQLTFGQCISKYMILEDCIIYSEYSGDYMDGAQQGETYGLHRINKDGSNDILLDNGYEIKFDVHSDWIYYISGKDIRKIKTDGSRKTTLTLNEKSLWLVGNISFFIKDDYLYSSLWLESNGKCEGSALIRINLNTEIEELLFIDEKNEVRSVSPSYKHEQLCYTVRDENWNYNYYFMNFDGSGNMFLYSDSSSMAAYNPVCITNDWIYFGCLDMLQGEVKRNEVFRFRHDGSCRELVYQNPDKPFSFFKNKVCFEDWSYLYVTEVDLPKSTLELIRNAVVLKIGYCDTIAFGEYRGIDESNAMIVPYIDNERAMVPVRFISETFGSKVDWEPDTNIVSVKLNGTTIEMTIGEAHMQVGDTEVALDVAPQIKDGRSFLPLRALCEALGKTVFWNNGIIEISDSATDAESFVKAIPYLSDEFYGIGMF